MALINVLGQELKKTYIPMAARVHGGSSGSFGSNANSGSFGNKTSSSSGYGSNLGLSVNDLFKINQENTAMSQAFAREQMQFQAQQAQLNRDWQEMMSNTAFQRQVADLKKAGLNPILGFAHGGSGASTPSGSGSLSGSKGDVDTSAISAMAAIAAASINAAATVQVANIHNQANPNSWIYNLVGSSFKELGLENPLGTKSPVGSLINDYVSLLVNSSSKKSRYYQKS